MDEPSGQYLHPIAGLDAALWVPPSRGQLFWLRRAPALFAPARGTGRGLNHTCVIPCGAGRAVEEAAGMRRAHCRLDGPEFATIAATGGTTSATTDITIAAVTE